MLVSVLRDLHWTLTNPASISSKTRRPRYSFTEESITIILLAVSLAHSHCDIRFRARVWRLMHGAAWARFSAAAKETNFTRKDRRTHSLSMRKPNTSAAKLKYSRNWEPVWKSDSHGTSVGLTT